MFHRVTPKDDRPRVGIACSRAKCCVGDRSGQAPEAGQEKPQESKPAEPKQPEPPTERVEVPAVAAAVDPKTYVVGVQDVVFVKVWREAELSGLYVVRPDGKISMPLVGEIVATGTTPDQLKERITAGLGVFMNRPEVMIEIHQVNSKRYYMTGEVKRPGPYPLVTPLTILEAISHAGGLRDFANSKKIVIMRNGERLKFNYKDVIKGKNLDQNIQIEPGDHILVP
jgi:polysaccharide export outer membrane protein